MGIMKKRIKKRAGIFLAVMLVCIMAGWGSKADAADVRDNAAGTASAVIISGEENEAETPEATEVPEAAEVSDATEIPGLTDTPEPAEIQESAEISGMMETPGMPESSGITETSGMSETTETVQTPEGPEPENFSSGEASFKLSVLPEETEVRAGSQLLYNVTLENTGDLLLKNLRIRPEFEEEGLTGNWDTSEGLQISGTEAVIDSLEASETKVLYLLLSLPEDYAGAVNLTLRADAGFEGDSGSGTGTVTGSAESTVNVRELQADFEVTKTADRAAAVSGDRVLFQICIRNTGGRTLHSVITTEKFKLQGVPVEFVEKEGVTLNNTKTKARIEAIEPGQAMSLQAVVTLPENIRSQELVNEVAVTTAETGERIVVSQAKLKIYGTAEEDTENNGTDIETGTAPEEKKASAVMPPKTGDDSSTGIWIVQMCGALAVILFLRGKSAGVGKK